MDKHVWSNEFWAIIDIDAKWGASTALVLNKQTGVAENVIIEHIQQGQSLLTGNIAVEDYNHFVSNMKLPDYIQLQLSVLIDEQLKSEMVNDNGSLLNPVQLTICDDCSTLEEGEYKSCKNCGSANVKLIEEK